MKKTLLSAIALASIVYLPAAQASAPFGQDDYLEAQTPILSVPGTYDINPDTLIGASNVLPYGVYDANGNFNYAIDLTITNPVDIRFSLSTTNGVQLTGVYLQNDDTGVFYDQGFSFNALTGVYSSSADLGVLTGANWELEVYGTLSATATSAGFTGSVTSVAEPEQLALMLLGLPLISWAARRKSAK